jgi:hypothetical protein
MLGGASRSADAANMAPEDLPQAARDALRDAGQALADAAAQTAEGNSQRASDEAGQGARDLDAAQSALQQMQGGVGGLSPAPGQGESQQAASGQQSSPGSTGGKTGGGERRWQDNPAAVQTGAQGAQGPGQFVGLPDRDRAAIQQSQSEKYPPEYGPMIEQYMRSLANDSGEK